MYRKVHEASKTQQSFAHLDNEVLREASEILDEIGKDYWFLLVHKEISSLNKHNGGLSVISGHSRLKKSKSFEFNKVKFWSDF